MNVETITTNLQLKSGSMGEPNAVRLPNATANALNAKHGIFFLTLLATDADVVIKVFMDDGPDGQDWREDAATVVDTGDGSDAEAGTYGGDTGALVFGAWARFRVEIAARTGSSQVTAQVNLKAVWKPF